MFFFSHWSHILIFALFFSSISLLIIAHPWLICCNVQQFLMLKILTWIYFIAAATSLLLILWKEDLYRISISSNEGSFDIRSGLTWTLETIAEVYLSLLSKSLSTVWLLKSQQSRLNSLQRSFCSRLHEPFYSVFCFSFSSDVFLDSCKYVMFCLAQQLSMLSIPKAPLRVSSVKS